MLLALIVTSSWFCLYITFYCFRWLLPFGLYCFASAFLQLCHVCLYILCIFHWVQRENNKKPLFFAALFATFCSRTLAQWFSPLPLYRLNFKLFSAVYLSINARHLCFKSESIFFLPPLFKAKLNLNSVDSTLSDCNQAQSNKLLCI